MPEPARDEFPVIRQGGQLARNTAAYLLPLIYRTAAGQLVCPSCADFLPTEQVLAARVNWSHAICAACGAKSVIAR